MVGINPLIPMQNLYTGRLIYSYAKSGRVKHQESTLWKHLIYTVLTFFSCGNSYLKKRRKGLKKKVWAVD